MTISSNGNPIRDFIKRWKESGAAERAIYQLSLSELTDVLGVARPEPAQSSNENNSYFFEHAVIFNNGDGTTSTGRIDLYKRGCFVLEAKQGSDPVVANSLFPSSMRLGNSVITPEEEWLYVALTNGTSRCEPREGRQSSASELCREAKRILRS